MINRMVEECDFKAVEANNAVEQLAQVDTDTS